MGLLLSCDKCVGSGTETVITFSDKLVKRVADGIIDEEQDEEVNEFFDEQNWMDKIKCIDDSHTVAYGLSTDSFNALVRNLELKFKRETELRQNCASSKIIDCLEKNQECPLKCNPEAKRFESCIDTMRLKQIKERMRQIESERNKTK